MELNTPIAMALEPGEKHTINVKNAYLTNSTASWRHNNLITPIIINVKNCRLYTPHESLLVDIKLSDNCTRRRINDAYGWGA